MNAVRLFLHKYGRLFQVEWSVMLAYRSESIIWMVGAFVQPLISLAVWLTISGTGSINGYGAREYILYFLGVLLVERLTRSWDVWELDQDIREGTFSAKLLRPFHPIHWSVTQNLVYKTFFALLMVPAWVLLGMFFPALSPSVDGTTIILFIVAIVGSSAVRFLTGYMFGLLAFWTNRAISIFLIYEMAHLLLSGRIAPLSMYPDGWLEWSLWLPFYVTVGFPVELLSGRLVGDTQLIVLGFAGQFTWIIILAIALRLQWKAGLKKYGAVGG
jgi:ABC-2 type transport system permease protein